MRLFWGHWQQKEQEEKAQEEEEVEAEVDWRERTFQVVLSNVTSLELVCLSLSVCEFECE